jgi:hypothetical protein
LHQEQVLLIWDLLQDHLLSRRKIPGSRVLGASATGCVLLVGDTQARGVCDLETGDQRTFLPEEVRPLPRIALSPKGACLLRAGDKGELFLCEALSGRELWRGSSGDSDVVGVAWHPSGKSFFSISERDARVRQFEPVQGRLLGDWTCRIQGELVLGLRTDRPGIVLETVLGTLAYPPAKSPRENYLHEMIPANRFDLLNRNWTLLPQRTRSGTPLETFESLQCKGPQGWIQLTQQERVLVRKPIAAPEVGPSLSVFLARDHRPTWSTIMGGLQRWWKGQ